MNKAIEARLTHLESIAPSRTVIVGADDAECRRKLAMMGQATAEPIFILTGVPRTEGA
jgi:hypothetical protein